MAEAQERWLPAPETPPTSPLDLPQSEPRMAHGKIVIDDNGVHDFDFKKRLENPGPRKLKKLSRRSNPNSGSISSMSDLVTRSASVSSETSSLKKRISSLINISSNRDTLHKSNSAKSTDSVSDFQEDALPDTKQELEIRLNHHLAELDHLRKTVRAANDIIAEQCERYDIMHARHGHTVPAFMKRQRQLVHQTRANRDSYMPFIQFHRRQLERIRNKRIEIEQQAGLEPTLPEVYKSLWTDDDWARLFST